VEAEAGSISGTWTSVTDLAYSGGSARRTTVQGSAIGFTVSGTTEVGILTFGTAAGNTGGTISISVDGGAATTMSLDGRADTTLNNPALTRAPLVIPVTLPNTSAHTVTVSKSDAGAGEVVVDCVLIPSIAPPLITLNKCVTALSAGYNRYPAPQPTDTDVSTFNGYLDGVVTRFGVTDGSLVVLDPIGKGWDKNTMTCYDGQHPNDRGMEFFEDIQRKALLTMPFLPGTNYGTLIVEPGSVNPLAGVPAQVTGLTANEYSAGGTSIALSWTAPSAYPAITDYLVQWRTTTGPGAWQTFAHTASAATSMTVTGLTAGTSYDFRVAAINSSGTGAYSANVTGIPNIAIFVDNANRANNGSALGTSSSGTAWQVDGAASYFINDNSICSFKQSTVGLNYIDAGTGYPTEVKAKLRGLSTAVGNAVNTATVTGVDNGIVGRATDKNNFWMARVAAASYSIQKNVAGTVTTPTGGSTSVVPVPGDIVRLTFSGTTITLYVNGTQIAQVTGDSFNQTATRAGLWTPTSGGAYGGAFDDFIVS